MDKPVKSILMVSLSNLGDIILTTPVLQKLASIYPEARIDVISGAPGREIFKSHPLVRDVYVSGHHRQLLARVRQLFYLRKKRYGVIVDLKKTLLPYFIGAGYSGKRLFSPAGPRPDGHKRTEHLSVLKNLTPEPYSGADFFLPVKGQDMDQAAGIFAKYKGVKKVILCPGAKSHLKRWGSANYACLSDRLSTEKGCVVFITGGSEDRETVNALKEACDQPVVDICGKTSIGVLAALMKASELVVTNDSAPLHLASAVNAPTVAVFGPTDEKKYGPLSEKKIVVSPEKKCRPCEKALCATGPDEGCIAGITVDEVFEACGKILNN